MELFTLENGIAITGFIKDSVDLIIPGILVFSASMLGLNIIRRMINRAKGGNI